MAKAKFNTTIRLGAAHCDMKVVGKDQAEVIDLTKTTNYQRHELAAVLVQLHEIPGTMPKYKPPHRKPRKLGDKHGNDKTRNAKGPRHGTTPGVPSGEAAGPHKAGDAKPGQKRPSRKPRTLSAPRPDA